MPISRLMKIILFSEEIRYQLVNPIYLFFFRLNCSSVCFLAIISHSLYRNNIFMNKMQLCLYINWIRTVLFSVWTAHLIPSRAFTWHPTYTQTDNFIPIPIHGGRNDWNNDPISAKINKFQNRLIYFSVPLYFNNRPCQPRRAKISLLIHLHLIIGIVKK